MPPSNPPRDPAHASPTPTPVVADTAGATVVASADRPVVLLTALAVAISLWIFVSTLNVVRAGWIAIPILDDWDRWITYVSDHYNLNWFFREHVDHRLVMPKVLFAIDHLVFHGRGWFLLVCTLCLQALSGGILWWLSGRAYRQAWWERVLQAAAIISCVFSAQQWMNLTQPFQVQFPLVYCAAAAAMFAIWKSVEEDWSPLWIGVSIGLATIATYSMANGILLWPVMLLAGVWLGMPRRWMQTVGGCWVVVGVSYFYNWHKSVLPGDEMSMVQRLPRVLVFWFGHLGSPMLPLAMLGQSDNFRLAAAAIPGVLLALALLVGFVMLWRRREQYSSAYAVVVFYGVFLVATSAMIAYGRSGGQLLEIYSTRYLTPSYLFWVSILIMAWPWLRKAPRVVLCGGVCAAMLVGIALHQRVVLNIIHDRANGQELGEIAVVDNVTDPEAWSMLFHSPSMAMSTVDYLRNANLTVFTEEWTHWPGIPLNRRFSIDHTPDACQGQFDKGMTIFSPLKPGWRVTGWAWDNKAGRSPRYIILADDTGMVAGVGLTGFPPPPALAALSARYVSSTWNGYVGGQARSITAYVVEADDRSLCAIGTQKLRLLGSDVPFKEAGLLLPVSAPELGGSFNANGYYKGMGGPGIPPVDGPIYGSFPPDAGTGTIQMGPFHLDGHTEMVIPIVSGPDNP